MMTDHDERHFPEGDPLEDLASDLWGVQKAISAMTDEEQRAAWYQAVDVLHDFGKLAETLHNDALLLAVTDAKERAREEFNRVVYRLDRPEGADSETLHPQEEVRLKRLLRRSDALNNAWVVMHDEDLRRHADRPDYAEELAILGAIRDEANEAFKRYRLEIGLKD